jgi:hypothetical protein
MTTPGRQTIYRLRADVTEDDHGNDVRDWTTPDQKAIRGCAVEPGAPAEYLIGRDASRVQWFVMAPLRADVRGTDRVKWQGVTYEVSGQPAPWPSDSGRLDYLAIVLQTWNG